MALYGNTILELAREKKINNRIRREVVKRIEKHNAITPWVQNVIRQGNFNMSIPNSVIMPMAQWFNGCVLTSETNDATLGMIASNSNITACAGSSTDSGSTDNRRGAFNSVESGDITNGRRFIWDWPTDRGNGSIASVCLTRGELALSEYFTDRFPSSTFLPINSIVSEAGTTNGASTRQYTFSLLTIIDYEKEVGYSVTYSNGGIVVTEYPLSTKAIKLLDSPFLVRAGYDGSIVKTVHNIANTTISSPTPAVTNTSVSYTGTHIHWVTWSGSTIKDYVINTTTWELDSSYGTGGVITRTFSGVTFMDIRNKGYNQVAYAKDIYPIIGNYIWMWGTVSSVPKILKCNLLGSSATEIFEYANPYYTVGSIVSDMGYYNGPCVYLPNGDFYKMVSHVDYGQTTSGGYNYNYCLYHHNNKIYLCKQKSIASTYFGNTNAQISLNANAYGTVLGGCGRYYNTGARSSVELFHPYVSTVNNLDETVIKSADLTMKLQYDITESSGS